MHIPLNIEISRKFIVFKWNKNIYFLIIILMKIEDILFPQVDFLETFGYVLIISLTSIRLVHYHSTYNYSIYYGFTKIVDCNTTFGTSVILCMFSLWRLSVFTPYTPILYSMLVLYAWYRMFVYFVQNFTITNFIENSKQKI